MTVLKSTYQIFNNPWKEVVQNIDPFPAVCLPTNQWKNLHPMELHDVKLWEQIYYEPGVIGVYAAWDPKDELYLLTYNCFLAENTGYKLFYGKTAVENVIEELTLLEVDIPVRTISVP